MEKAKQKNKKISIALIKAHKMKKWGFEKGLIPKNKGVKGLQPWHNISGLTGHLKGAPLSKEHKKSISLAHKKLNRDKEYFRKMGNLGVLKQSRSKEPTGIEKKLYQELKSRGLLFEEQKLINGRFLVDAYIPSLNLIIEADGDYWHKLDRVQKKDKAENAYLTECGYNLLRLSEHEINDGSFKEKIN